MQLFLSGAESYLGTQKDGDRSLGGYVSSTPVPNNRINALFNDVSKYAQDNEIEETIAIFLVNTSGSAKNNIKLSQIYDNKFLDDINACTFQWAAVTTVSNQKIESIDNKRDQPFYATFFDPTSRKADAILKILSPAEEGDIVTVLGKTTDPIMGGGLENVVDAIVLEFIGDTNYTVIKKSTNEVYFQRNTVGINTSPIVLTSLSVTAVNTAFSNGKDGTVLLKASLADKEAIGLWIKRKVKALVPKTDAQLIAEMTEEPIKIEHLSVSINWD